jgi:hypothetical protein
MGARWLGLQFYKREICGCVEKAAGVGGHSTQGIYFHMYEVTGNQLRPNPLLTQSIFKMSESVTRSKVGDQCSISLGCYRKKEKKMVK